MEKTDKPKYKKQSIAKSENYNRTYYEQNKAKWKQYNESQKQNYLDCEICKCSIQFSHKNSHLRTKKHIKNLELANPENKI